MFNDSLRSWRIIIPVLASVLSAPGLAHDFNWASVLLHSPSGWERIGVFNCWCRYESNPLEGFVEFRSVLRSPQTEILVHNSGGGSGLYRREVDVFRTRNGQLQRIYETTDKRLDCHPTQNKDYCTLTEARIEYNNLRNVPVLIVARLESIEPTPFEVFGNVRRIGCEVLLWDAAKTSFVKSSQWTRSYRRETPGARTR